MVIPGTEWPVKDGAMIASGGMLTTKGKFGPIQLQCHGDPVEYRNIWVHPLGSYELK